jgi:hypothetical protein
MKRTHIAVLIMIPVVIFLSLGAWIYQPAWRFDHLEQSARKVITGNELQIWGTNLLAQYPEETNFSPSQLGTNFPVQLLGLYPRIGPRVLVHVYDDTNQPPYVQLAWGSGFVGYAGFYIGTTNFTGWENENGYQHEMQPGVYFYHGP